MEWPKVVLGGTMNGWAWQGKTSSCVYQVNVKPCECTISVCVCVRVCCHVCVCVCVVHWQGMDNNDHYKDDKKGI